MIYRKPREDEWERFDALARHPLQSRAWGSFREEMGLEVTQLVGYEGERMEKQMQISFHKIPHFSKTAGYYPRGGWPTEVELRALEELGRAHKALFIKLEPNVSTPPYTPQQLDELKQFLTSHGCEKGRSLFTPHSFLLDIRADEATLLNGLKSKTRYNIRLAQRYGVSVVEDSSDAGFEDYLKLLELTTERQQFYAHDERYQRTMWKHMHGAGIARVLKAYYQGELLVAWVLFVHNGVLYYPYGASSRAYRQVMASNLVMWEAILLGKRLGLTHFDMWGALGPNPDQGDPWYGFHRFKEGYGGALTTFVGTYDLVLDPHMYRLFRVADRWRWRWLRWKKRIPFLR